MVARGESFVSLVSLVLGGSYVIPGRVMAVFACWVDKELATIWMVAPGHRHNVKLGAGLTAVLACWHDFESASGLAVVLAHWRNVELAEDLTTVLARYLLGR